jgi:signal transduction histidine kinase/DNA-binding response OmpR family regulator
MILWELDMPDGIMEHGRATVINSDEYGDEAGDWPQTFETRFNRAVYAEDRERVLNAMKAHINGETPVYEAEYRTQHQDGTMLWHLSRGVAIRNRDGKPIRFLGSTVNITTLKRLEEELRQAKEAAEAANRAKDEFLANVSHEIRTPMNAILGMTELVLEAPLGDDQRQSLRTVKSAADNLLGIINDLLDFSKIEAGKLELDPGDFSLRSAVGDTLRALAVRAHRKGLEIVCNVQADVPDALVGDAGRLRQVLLNLVGNAIKFTERGEVIVHVSSTADSRDDGEARIHFAVRDTGIGIPPEKKTTIFRAFEQEDTSTTRKYGGTGLGLTIAAQLVELMGGSIAVESQPGRGSTFSFTARFGKQAHSIPSAVKPPRGFHNLRVLIVDDNTANREIMERWLRDWQMEPTAVGDAMAAMDAMWHGIAIHKSYDLLLLDARMPDTDGLTLAAKIRERAELSGSRIILLTSGDRPGDTARFRDLRIDEHLLKPVQQDELLNAIYSIMSRTTERMKEEGGRMNEPMANEPAANSSFILHPSSSSLRILVAEDSEFNALLMEKLLLRRGHAVTLVSNGREAVNRANRADFDLLLLDVHMPELDGFGVIREIRERERTAGGHLPVIALTARSRKEDRERCLAAGMDDFLSKPIQTDELWVTIDRVAGRSHERLIDARVLMSACGGDEGILKGICQALRARLPDDLASIQDALLRQDASRLREAAHKLAGMVSAFSTKVGAVASDIEDYAARAQLDEAASLVAKLNAMAGELLQAVGNLSMERLRRDAASDNGPAQT